MPSSTASTDRVITPAARLVTPPTAPVGGFVSSTAANAAVARTSTVARARNVTSRPAIRPANQPDAGRPVKTPKVQLAVETYQHLDHQLVELLVVVAALGELVEGVRLGLERVRAVAVDGRLSELVD